MSERMEEGRIGGAERFGEAAAVVLLESLARYRPETSSKHILDTLRADESEALFSALERRMRGGRRVEIAARDAEGRERVHRLGVIEHGGFDVVPYLADGAGQGEEEAGGSWNRGSEGFACKLRDVIVQGEVARPRLLLTVLVEKGETVEQKPETLSSAQEQSIDRRLVALQEVVDVVLAERGVGPGSALGSAVRVFVELETGDDGGLRPSERRSWVALVERVEAFLDAAAAHPAEAQGLALGALGCFMPDASPGFAGDEVPDSARQALDSRGQRGSAARLRANAATRAFIERSFEDANVEVEEQLGQAFDEQSVKRIVAAGVQGVGALLLEALAPATETKRSRRNAFELDTLEVRGARAWHVLGREGGAGDERVVLISADAEVSLHVVLREEIGEERVRLINAEAQTGRRYNMGKRWIDAERGALAAVFRVDCSPEGAPFQVLQAVIARGPRTMQAFHDAFWIVACRGEAPVVVYETARVLDAERHAWVCEERAIFKALTPGQEASGGALIERSRAELEAEEEAEGTDEADDEVTRSQLAVSPGQRLPVRIVWAAEREETDDVVHDLLEYAPWRTQNQKPDHRRRRLLGAMQKEARVLASITDLSRGAGQVWRVEVGRALALNVRAYNTHGAEQAVARALLEPARYQHTRREGEALRSRTFDEGCPGWSGRFERLMRARREVFKGLLAAYEERTHVTQRVEHIEHGGVPLHLLDLEPLSGAVEGYAEAWLEAIEAISGEACDFEAEHEALLQLDVLINQDAHGATTRLTLLPTHPWLLLALLRFQRIMDACLRAAPLDKKSRLRLALTPGEARELAPDKALEDWIWRDQRLRTVNGAPHHFEFLPAELFQEQADLDYVRRIVRDKLRRYLEMHAYLRDSRRVLKIGYVNPGDGRLLLDGLRAWLQRLQTACRKRDQDFEAALREVPTLEVTLFSRDEGAGAAFDAFFRERLGTSNERELERALMLKLRYRKSVSAREGEGPVALSIPRSEQAFVHLCFVSSLVQPEDYQDLDGRLDEGWDGCFAEGLVSTHMRRSKTQGDELHSVRGLWVSPGADALRRGLVALLSLQRGARLRRLQPQHAIYWRAKLPNMRELAPLYAHSDWVVHLDRELNLQMFRGHEDEDAPPVRIIEYSDQHSPMSPGYDTITVTQHSAPYLEQLRGVLRLAGLDVHKQTRFAEQASAPVAPQAERAAQELLTDINVISGSWALDFLGGNITLVRSDSRLKGNLGAALVYRWLERVERPALEARFGPGLVLVYVSLEDLMRATPATGLPTRDGLKQRFGEGQASEARAWCDDLLVLYLHPTQGGERVIHGRIIEVKLGASAHNKEREHKAAQQIRSTHALLTEHLSGDDDHLDAPFRHRQLSLLIKNQLDQALAMGVISAAQIDALDLPRLSADIAQGNYRVDYNLSVASRNVCGDAFLLSTTHGLGREVGRPELQVDDGVRVLRFNRATVEWLAFEEGARSMQDLTPRQTLPSLGSQGQTLRERLGAAAPPGDAPGDDAPAPGDATPPGSAAPRDGAPQPTDAPPPPLAGLYPSPATSPDPSPTLQGAAAAPLPLDAACEVALYQGEHDQAALHEATQRLEHGLRAHKIRLAAALSIREVDVGPRLVRVYAQLEPGESIGRVRSVSEDLARHVGVHLANDLRVSNIPERRAIGLDLPIEGLGYEVDYEMLTAHPSFAAARQALHLPFCAGVAVTGRPLWVDLAQMPHMLVAGTTGSGKTVFLRSVVLTLLQQHPPARLDLRLASSKPMDFKLFTRAPHTRGRGMASDPGATLRLAEALVSEMERRIHVIEEAFHDNLLDYNADPETEAPLPFIVAVIDEFAETVLAFDESATRARFEAAIGRLAQTARVAGIHLVLCMQRPDSTVIKGPIKSNILHRFALKLPQQHDSRVVLDEGGAETLLGKGDLLYRDENSRTHRLQVPFLPIQTFRAVLKAIVGRPPG